MPRSQNLPRIFSIRPKTKHIFYEATEKIKENSERLLEFFETTKEPESGEFRELVDNIRKDARKLYAILTTR